MAFKRLGRRFYRLGRRSRSNSPAQALSTNIGISADTASITAADTVPASTTATDTAPAGKITIATAPAATTTSLPERLWDQAYDNLKVKEEALIQAYEKILSRVIRGDGIVSQEDESEHNTIEQKNTHARKNQMLQLTYAGLNKTAQQARVKGNLNEAMKAVLTLKDTISIGLQAAPEAALPWAGICVTLQLFTNPLTESKSNRDGIIYVINRMDWYLKLSKLLFKKNTMQGSDISDVQRELETRLVDFYTLLLLYQIKSVCSYYRHGGLVFLRDLVKLDDWDGNLSAIREAENGFNRDTNAYNGQKAVSYIEQLVSYQITEKDQQCIKDLRLTDPRDDKTRIEQTKGGLLQDSFRWILDNSEFQQWRDNDQSRLLWIKGDPGKGKTMLLCGIVDELKKSTTSYSPVSFFFCQATDSHINNATAVLRGLIYLFIEQQPSLVSHIRKKYDLAGKQLFEGANVWVALSGILTDILHDPALKAAYLIIDALDECVSGLTQLLKLVIQNVSASPHVKWIVSSRNWPSIERQLSLADGAGGVRLSLEVNANIISSAVDTYIEHKVSQLVSIKNDKKLQDQVRLRMCQKANSTFLWVALVFKKLQDLDDAEYEDGSDILKILEAMPSDLTEFYARMIQQIDLLQGDDPERCRTILSIMTLAYQPLNLLELPILAGFNGNLTTTSALGRLVNKCGSFLTVRDGTIYFIHQSAKDYLTTNGSARSIIFPSGSEDAHHTISIRSLKAMHDKLRRNIYALHRPGLLIDEVNAPELDPLTAVQYSCIHWVGHLCEGYANGSTTIYQNDFDDGGVISLFLREHFLHWLEALSLLRNMSDGALSITKLGSLLMEQSPKCELFSFIKDARRFILHNRQVIENAPLQTYSSALIFSPMQSLTRLMFKKDEPRWIKTIPIIESNWSPCLQTLEGHSDSINSVAFSSDSKLVASGSWDKTVKIWDAATGTEVQTLKGHSHWVLSVAFSSDSKLVASGSADNTVKIWDAATGTEVQTLKGHSNWVNSVAFSRDSKLVASGSNDNTVKIWDAATGTEVQTLKGHSNWVNSVAFSSDSKLVASGSGDGTIKIWDAATGAEVQTLKGHRGSVFSVTFPSDSKLVASGSNDKTVKIWDAAMGTEVQTLKGHSRRVNSVAFLSDSKLVASGSNDKTVKIWDAATGTEVQTLKGHSDSVKSVAFSSDSKLVASGSNDNTVKIWDAATGTEVQTLKGHSRRVNSVAFSSDSKLVASGSGDGTIKIWDAATGTEVQTLKGHSGSVFSVAFSSDSKLVASGSYDKTVKIWDAAMGAEVQTLKGHNDSVFSVAFSSDSKLVASGSYDDTVKIWDAATGTEVQTLKGHSDSVKSVAFSSDSKLVASGSDDETVKIWDAATGTEVQTLDISTSLSSISFDATSSCLLTNIGPIRLNSIKVSDTSAKAHDQAPLQSSARHQYSLSSDQAWISCNGNNELWLPPDYRPVVSAVSLLMVAIGCSSGRVITIGFSEPPTP